MQLPWSTKAATQQSATIALSIQGMHCVACSLAIDGDLEDLPGVQSAVTNYAAARTVVMYDPDKVDRRTIISTIQQLGYTVSDR